MQRNGLPLLLMYGLPLFSPAYSDSCVNILAIKTMNYRPIYIRLRVGLPDRTTARIAFSVRVFYDGGPLARNSPPDDLRDLCSRPSDSFRRSMKTALFAIN